MSSLPRRALGNDEPWTDPGVRRRDRRRAAAAPAGVTSIRRRGPALRPFPICTLALTWYLDRPVTDLLAAEIDRVVRAGSYERRVFFVRPIGFVRATAAHRISFEDSLRFERLHEQAYRTHGFELVDVPDGEVTERAAAIDQLIRSWGSPGLLGMPTVPGVAPDRDPRMFKQMEQEPSALMGQRINTSERSGDGLPKRWAVDQSAEQCIPPVLASVRTDNSRTDELYHVPLHSDRDSRFGEPAQQQLLRPPV